MRGNRGLLNGILSSYLISFTEELHTRLYMVTIRRCVWNKTFLLISIITSNGRPPAVPSSSQALIHHAILFIDTSDNASYNQLHWLIGMSYLSIIASSAYGVTSFHASFHYFLYCFCAYIKFPRHPKKLVMTFYNIMSN